VIFEDHPPNLVRVCSRIFQDLADLKSPTIFKSCGIVRPPLLDNSLAVGFFYGASQDRVSLCGVGVVLKCPSLGIFRLKMNCGKWTNTRGEILALWCILYFSFYKNIQRLQLVGDSKVIID